MELEKELTSLNNDIKAENFKNIYFFYGKEEYLKNFYMNKITNKLLNEDEKDMNFASFTKENFNIEKVKEQIETMPFLSNKKVITLTSTKFLGLKEAGNIIMNIPEYAVLFILEEEIGKISKRGKKDSDENYLEENMDYITKNGTLIELDKVTDGLAIKKMMSIAKENGLLLSKENAQYLVNRIGVDLMLLMQEINKLCSYSEVEIKKEDIEKLCVQSLESKVFDLIKYITSRDINRSLECYNTLVINKESDIAILGMIARQFIIMYEANLLDKKGFNISSIAKALEIKQDFVIKDCLMQSKRYGVENVKKIIGECLKTDLELKNGKKSLELLINKLVLCY